MPIVKWLLWRRWQFKSWIGPYYYPKLIVNVRKVNFGGCRDYPYIYRDMVKIINANRPG